MNYAGLELAIHRTDADWAPADLDLGADSTAQAGDSGSTVHSECHRILLDVVEGRLPIVAVRHPLGFFCLPVSRDDDLGVCIHVWTSALPGARATTSNVHCHSWDLISFVLYGQVSHTLLQVDDDARGPDQIFEIHSHVDIDEIMPTGRFVRSVRHGHRVTGPRASYRLAAGQFHSSVVEHQTEAATVVLGRTRGTLDLSIGARNTPGHRVRRQRCSADETAELARIAIHGLAGTSRDTSSPQGPTSTQERR